MQTLLGADAILFPSNPLNECQVDPEFEREWQALQFSGVQRALVNPDIERAMTNGKTIFRNLPAEAGLVLYRGWMLSSQEISALSTTLKARDFELLTSPKQYLAAHHIVNWLDAFAGLTPRTAFVSSEASDAEIRAVGSDLGSEQFFVKDYSQARMGHRSLRAEH